MSRKTIYTAVVVSALVAAGVSWMMRPAAQQAPANDKTASSPARQSAYQRVVASNTLRCGYAIWPTYLEKDPNTGQFSGIFYDYMNALGQMTGLKVEWTMEVGYGDFIEALHTGKIDAFCGGSWTNAIRAKAVTMIQPLFYQPLLAYVRADDTRFDNKLMALNDPKVKIATIDGEGSELTARQSFPKAAFLQLPQLSDAAQLLINVADGKADATLTDNVTAGRYDQHNPGKIRAVPSVYPIAIYGATIWINQNEPELKHWLDAVTNQMIGSGMIENFLKKHEPFPNAYYRVRTDFVQPSMGQ